MSRLEEGFLRRFSGGRMVAASIAAGIAGFAPLQLYIWFGPSDGNPIGLGLLPFAVLPFAVAGIGVGVVRMLVELFKRKQG